MRILLVNNFYYYRGGDCTYLFSLKKLLENKGHEIIVFVMHHPQNIASDYEKYFVSYINYEEELKDINISSGFKVFNRTIYSREAKSKIEKLIKDLKPDIAHIQNVHHHITPSVFQSLNNHNIPIIWTLHDYSLICPNTSFLSHGQICEKCKYNKLYWTSIQKCKKESLSASIMAGIETAAHRMIRLEDAVDNFIAPSMFLKNKFIEYGYPEDKITFIELFADIEVLPKIEESGDYYLYVGRVAQEKGLKTLIDAAIGINKCKLKIAGDGPLLNTLKEYVATKDNNNLIEFLGYQNRQELSILYRHCKFVIVPSEWYEPSGLIIFEAFATGKPVIGSRIGGIPELIEDTKRGLVFEPGDVEDLSAAIKYLLNNHDLVIEMGENARMYVRDNLNSEVHYNKLMKVYEEAISSRLHAR